MSVLLGIIGVKVIKTLKSGKKINIDCYFFIYYNFSCPMIALFYLKIKLKGQRKFWFNFF